MRRILVIGIIAMASSTAAFAQTPPPVVPVTQPPPQGQGQGRQGQQGQPGQQGQQGQAGRPGQQGQAGQPGRINMRQTPAPSRAPAQNIKLEVTFTDTFTGGQRKTVTLIASDNTQGRMRSVGNFGGLLNIDAFLTTAADGRIRIDLTMEYQPEGKEGSAARPGPLSQSVTLLVADGKQTTVSQLADPWSDRKVTVEVTASVVK